MAEDPEGTTEPESEIVTPWWKKPFVWIGTALTVVFGALVFLFTVGRKGSIRVTKPRGLKEIPERPKTPGVSVPEALNLDTLPKDDYDGEKKRPEDIADTIASVNSRHE